VREGHYDRLWKAVLVHDLNQLVGKIKPLVANLQQHQLRDQRQLQDQVAHTQGGASRNEEVVLNLLETLAPLMHDLASDPRFFVLPRSVLKCTKAGNAVGRLQRILSVLVNKRNTITTKHAGVNADAATHDVQARAASTAGTPVQVQLAALVRATRALTHRWKLGLKIIRGVTKDTKHEMALGRERRTRKSTTGSGSGSGSESGHGGWFSTEPDIDQEAEREVVFLVRELVATTTLSSSSSVVVDENCHRNISDGGHASACTSAAAGAGSMCGASARGLEFVREFVGRISSRAAEAARFTCDCDCVWLCVTLCDCVWLCVNVWLCDCACA
jgi:hypothetical protein